MAASTLFLGLLLLLWLALGTAGWLVVTLRCRRASLLALLFALPVAIIGGTLPALIGWKTFTALLCGLLLALVGSMLVAWQTMSRIGTLKNDGSAPSRAGTGEQDG